MANETKNKNFLQIAEAISGITDSVCRFNYGLKENLPIAKDQFEAAVTGAQRAVELARSQKLEGKFDGKKLIDPMSGLRVSISGLDVPVQALVEALHEWPELSVDLEIQKVSAIALLNDLLDFSGWAANLIARFLQYLSEE